MRVIRDIVLWIIFFGLILSAFSGTCSIPKDCVDVTIYNNPYNLWVKNTCPHADHKSEKQKDNSILCICKN